MKRTSGQRNSPKLTQSDYETLAQFRYLMRKFASFSEAAAREAGLTTQQHQALLAIRGFSGRERITVGELAERLNVRHHSVVGLVDRLAGRALVRRRRDAMDGRRVLLELGPKGRILLAGLSQAHRDELRRLAPRLKQLLAHLE
jgi:DNA-binding MarR family transcriptional regulator